MFPLQPSDELVFGTPTTSQGSVLIREDLIVDEPFMEDNIIGFGSSIRETTISGFPQRQAESRLDCKNVRGIMRREIERKRRQQMSTLFSSLQSLLPPEHRKGKSSVCDQVQKAANYTKEMQKKIQELRYRRDKLKVLSSSSSETKFESSNESDGLPKHVTVNLLQDGLEILIFCSDNSEFWLSKVLAELVEIELDVVSSVSTRTNGGFLHKIQLEARDMTSFDVSVLQNRLTNAIK